MAPVAETSSLSESPLLLTSTSTTSSGLIPSMSKSWETIREPGLSFSNCGISFTFSVGSR